MLSLLDDGMDPMIQFSTSFSYPAIRSTYSGQLASLCANEEEELALLRNRTYGPFKEIYLDGFRSHIRSFDRLRGINVSKVEKLSMINMRLAGLTTIPRMPKLESLDLSDNKITGNLQRLYVCPKLNYLNLSRNKIKTIETLVPLRTFKCLQSLDLFGNDVIYIDNYRKRVFALLKALRYLDGSIKEPEEEED